MPTELYRRFRPQKLADVIGQQDTVAMLQKKLQQKQLPHALLLWGPPGCGKTTLARILVKEMGCSDLDYREINAADSRGIEVVRDMQESCRYKPNQGWGRAWIIDEAHQLTNPAQQALLKILEDTPGWVYFFLCTTAGEQLQKAVRNRCTPCKILPLSRKELRALLDQVLSQIEEEVQRPTNKVILAILEAAQGSARYALVLLDKILSLASEEEQLEAIIPAGLQEEAHELAQELWSLTSTWPTIARSLKRIKDDDAEGVRVGIVRYAKTILLHETRSQALDRAHRLLSVFDSASFYHHGTASLTGDCYEFFRERR